MDELVALSAGFSGAEVVALSQEACMIAVEAEELTLSLERLRQAAAGIKPQITHEMIEFYRKIADQYK